MGAVLALGIIAEHQFGVIEKVVCVVSPHHTIGGMTHFKTGLLISHCRRDG